MEASLLFYVLRTLLPHDPAVPQGDDMVGVGGHLWIMRDQDDGLVKIPGKGTDHIHDLGGGFGVQVSGGLVGKDDVRAGDKARAMPPAAAGRRTSDWRVGLSRWLRPTRAKSSLAACSRCGLGTPRNIRGRATFSVAVS